MKKLLTIAALIISSMGIAQEDGIDSKLYLLKSKDEVKHILKREKCTFEIMNRNGFIIYCYCNGEYIELWFDEEDECIATIKHVSGLTSISSSADPQLFGEMMKKKSIEGFR